MNVQIETAIWGILSAVIFYEAVKLTNKKANGEQVYAWNKKNVILLISCLAVSNVTGYVAASKSTSILMWLLLTISYAAVLGAAVIDYKLHIIPNMIPCFLIIGKVMILLYELCCSEKAKWDIVSSIAGFIVFFVILMIAGLITHRGIGNGDVKLLASLGFVCGVYPVFVTLTFALLYCTAVSCILLFAKKVSLKDHLPFAPFIFMGYLSMIYYI